MEDVMDLYSPDEQKLNQLDFSFNFSISRLAPNKLRNSKLLCGSFLF